MRPISDKKLLKVTTKYEEKLTKAFFKGNDQKIEVLKYKFTKFFGKFLVSNNTPIGTKYNIGFSFPSNKFESVEIGFVAGDFTHEELKNMLEGKMPDGSPDNSDIEEIFGFGKDEKPVEQPQNN